MRVPLADGGGDGGGSVYVGLLFPRKGLAVSQGLAGSHKATEIGIYLMLWLLV